MTWLYQYYEMLPVLVLSLWLALLGKLACGSKLCNLEISSPI